MSRRLKEMLTIEKEFGVTEWPVGLTAPNPQTSLAQFHRSITDCRDCGLCERRTQVVFGEGNPHARVVFVGEAPGHDEDLTGRPFVGKAGELLTKMIEAMTLKREEVYIANCLKCRPPNNRSPLPTEIAACRCKLLYQLELIRPKVIVTLGKFATQTLLGTEVSITRLRGKFQVWNETKVMPTFHPAYLLRNPVDKKWVWEDLKQVMAELGISS